MTVQPVPASLCIVDAVGELVGEPIDARVMAEARDGDGPIRLSIVLSPQTEWVLELDPGPAAYLAAVLAVEAGVKFA